MYVNSAEIGSSFNLIIAYTYWEADTIPYYHEILHRVAGASMNWAASRRG